MGKDPGHLEADVGPVRALEGDQVAFRGVKRPRHPLADGNGAGCQRRVVGGHDGVVRAGRRLVIVAPEPALHLADPGDFFERVDVARRDEVVPPGHEPLDDDLRRPLEHGPRLALDGLGEEDHRRQGEHDEGVHQGQGEVLLPAPAERREGEVDDVAVAFEQAHRGRRCGGGRIRVPDGKCSTDMGLSWKAVCRSAMEGWRA